VKRFRGGLVFKAHRLVYHSTLGWRVIKREPPQVAAVKAEPDDDNGGLNIMAIAALNSPPMEGVPSATSLQNVYAHVLHVRFLCF